MIDVELPRVVYSESNGSNIIKKSNANQGVTLLSDGALASVNTFSKNALCINVEVLD